MSNFEQNSLKKRNRGHNKRIGFSKETVTKDAANNLLSKDLTDESDAHTFFSKLVSEESIDREAISKKKPKKRKQTVLTSNDELRNDENTSVDVNKKVKKRKTKQVGTETISQEKAVENDQSATNGSNKSLSKRALKSLKYQKILENKKIESDKNVRQNALNYLSNWKYNKSEWKFQKLKQIWLIQNLYDSFKIDDKYWEDVVEYFANSQGKVHKEILEKAVKIIENEEIELNDQVKFKRARDIVQSLQ